MYSVCTSAHITFLVYYTLVHTNKNYVKGGNSVQFTEKCHKKNTLLLLMSKYVFTLLIVRHDITFAVDWAVNKNVSRSRCFLTLYKTKPQTTV